MKLNLLKKIIGVLSLISLFLSSCSDKEKGASDRLQLARNSLSVNHFQEAKNHLDSIKILYPKSFDEQRVAIALLDTIRRAENDFTIHQCDSLIATLIPKVDSMKKSFHYIIDKNYQESGIYTPKEGWNNGQLLATTLRPGVKENGALYIESIYIGGNQMHDRMVIIGKSGEDGAKSAPVSDDGLNFRFTNLGKQYEIIRFEGKALDMIPEFVAKNQDKSLTVFLKGTNGYEYQLSSSAKKAINLSYSLSTSMLKLDSLKEEKNKAEFRNYKLTEKQPSIADEGEK